MRPFAVTMSRSATPDPSMNHLITETRDRLKAPWAAGVAGLVFSFLFVVSLLLLRGLPVFTATDAEVADWFASGGDTAVVIAALYCIPFAAVAFLWFVAVIRDQIGDREDQFFSTVFFGSGLLFVTMMMVTAATSAALVVGVRYLQQPPPSAETVGILRSLSYTVMFAMGTRAAALFMIATATVGLRSGTFPRSFALVGYLIGLLLLLVVSFFDSIILLIPGWVAFVSVFILIRQRRHRRSAAA